MGTLDIAIDHPIQENATSCLVLIEPELLSYEHAAQFLGISRATLYKVHSTDMIGPRPVQLGSRELWRRRELISWVAMGCPSREVWESETKGKANASL